MRGIDVLRIEQRRRDLEEELAVLEIGREEAALKRNSLRALAGGLAASYTKQVEATTEGLISWGFRAYRTLSARLAREQLDVGVDCRYPSLTHKQ